MKSKLFIAALAALVTSANAAVTLSFTTAGGGALTNFLDGAGTGTTAMVWGVLVDTGGDGFQGMNANNPYDEGFSLNSVTTGLALTVNNGTATNDRLFIAPGFMSINAAVTDGNAIGTNRLLSMTNMNIASPVAFGQSYAIIWFDSLTRVTTTEGMKYGVFVPSGANVGLANTTTNDKLPGTDGTYAYGNSFSGVDSAKTMQYALGAPIPETSTSLLGAIGALALLRRRRN